jgi:hypothetical protein
VFSDQISNFCCSVMHPSIYFLVMPFISSLVTATVC